MKICIINGPNLNMVGHGRNAKIYGSDSFDTALQKWQSQYPDVQFQYFQSNHEGEIIDFLQSIYLSDNKIQGIIINPGGLSHTSVSLRDCIEMSPISVFEVHLSNIKDREEFRKKSLTGSVALSIISGHGMNSYTKAIEKIMKA